MSEMETMQGVAFVVDGLPALIRAYTSAAVATERGTRALKEQERAASAASRAQKYTDGPQQRLSRLSGQLQRARAEGNAPAIADLEFGVHRARQQIENRAPKSFGTRLADTLKTSRIGGAGLNPLVGKVAGLAEGTALGPLARLAFNPIVAVALLTAAALNKLAEGAAASTRSFTALENATGSSGVGAARLATEGRALGLSPEAIAGISGHLNSAITSDPTAAAFGQRFGVQNQPGPFGNVDQGSQVLKVIDGLRKITDQQERIRTARALGVEQLLPAALLSDGTMNKLRKDANIKASIFDPAQQARSAEFDAERARLDDAFQNLEGALAKGVIPVLTWLTSVAADTAQGFAGVVNWVDHLLGLDSAGNDGTGASGYGQTAQNAQTVTSNNTVARALDMNTRALSTNTNALGAAGTYGKGQRLSGALQSGMGGEALTRNMDAGAYRLGAF